jgi:CRISPR/Cas system-associated exonuclease Cas4 (RecB family)
MTEAADHTSHKKSFEDGVQIAWDATSIELYQTCPRKYYYTMIRGVQPKRKSVHLIFGGIYASALEHFYKHRAKGDDIQTALRKVVHEAMIESWDHHLDEDGERVPETGNAVVFEDAKKTRPNLIRTLVWYIEQFAIESEDGMMTYHLQNGAPAVELSFTLDVEDFLLCGHLDRVVSMGDSLYVMDQKTTGGTIGTYYFDTFSPNTQMSLYSWAGQAILHSPVTGVIIDAAQIAVNWTRFERGITTRSKSQLEEWFQSAKHHIHAAQHSSRTDFWPMNTASCGNYGGCPFRSLCSRSPQVRENYLKSDYITHNWDPIKRR